jgi:hypothetical protein
MKKASLGALVAALAILAADVVSAQAPRRPPGTQPGGNQPGGNRPGGNRQGQNEAEEYKQPEDPKIIELYKTMILAMEKLAADYEKTNQTDKARECYVEILRVAPKYTVVQDKLKAIKMKESIAERKQFEVFANKAWQDTGVNVAEGKPISIKATGSWSMKMAYTLPPDGIEIPEELRNFPLGALVGAIVEPNTPPDEMKPFLVGSSKSFDSPKKGRLLLRIYDSDPEDNTGKLSVTIEGTFAK